MQEMNTQEVEAVGGALSSDAGGVAITALAVTAALVGSPFIAGAGIVIGLGLLFASL